MTVTRRLLLLVGVAWIGIVAICAIGLMELEKVRDSASYATVNSVPSYEVLDDTFQDVVTAMGYVSQHVIANDKTRKAELGSKFDNLWPQMLGTLKKYEPLISDDQDRKLLEIDRALLSEYDLQRKKIFEASNADQIEEVRKLMVINQSTIDQVNSAFQAHRKYNHTLADAGDQEARRIYGVAMWAFLGITVLAIGVSIVTAVITGKTLLKQLSQAVEVVHSVAAGELTATINAPGKDEISMLMRGLSTMQTSLVTVVSNVRQGSDAVATASAEIARGNNDLSARTENQASALEQTASSMEQLNATVKQNADNARQANQLAMRASTVAIQGGEVVSQVVDTMKDINEASRKITDIIQVIDGIAFQTNILALNAAVEAARAGEQGRGFAVVASEVRSLAGRSADAAKEIKSLINASVERVEQGTTLVDQAGITMTEVVSSIKRVTDLMGEISAASSEQSAGVSQVGEAITQMDTVTQQNAALVEEMAAAAGSLKSLAHDLVQTVAVFKLSPHDGQRKGPALISIGASMAPRAAA